MICDQINCDLFCIFSIFLVVPTVCFSRTRAAQQRQREKNIQVILKDDHDEIWKIKLNNYTIICALTV